MKQRTDNFSKFANQKKGSAIKEAFRQEKKKQKAAAQAEGEAIRRKKIEKAQGILPEKQPNFRNEKKGKFITKRGPQKPVAYGTYRPTEDERKVSNKRTDNHAAASAGETAMPLNKFIAHCGVCGRREAADLIKQGKITANGDIIYEPGCKVTGKEKVSMGGKTLHLKHNQIGRAHV